MAAPCVWDITVSEECCPNWATYSVEVQERSLRLATFLLWAATGRRYGPCPVTVRPCGNDRMCRDCGFWAWDSGWMRPYIMDGLWRNCLCTCACTCEPHCQVRLPGPVASVTQVLVDGVVVPATSYRVDDNQWLVRTDGECWPKCQDYNVDVPAAGTFEVTYGRGEPIPAAILDVAGILACELAKACARDSSCRLPGRLQTLTRQGVTASMVPIDQVLKYGLTGLVDVDAVIMADNPYGLRARPWLYSRDTAPRVRTVTQP
jgi:hypothetical protein